MNILYSPDEFRDMFISCDFNIPKNKDSGLVRCNQHEDNHPSMSVSISKGLFHCYSCGYSGFIPKVYREKFNQPYRQTHKTLNPDSLKKIRDSYTNENKSYGFKAVWDVYKPYSKINWLEYRGIDPQVCESVGLKYGSVRITYTDSLNKKVTYSVNDRYLIPIYGEDGTLKSIEMRYPFTGLESDKFKATVKKCLYPKKSSTNFLFEYAKLNKNKKLYVLEGLMDCLAFRSLTGIKNSTTIFGAQITKHQLDRLNEFSELCYVYNNDKAGIDSVEKLKENYKNGKLTLLKPLRDFNDVGEMAIAKVSKKDINEWLYLES